VRDGHAEQTTADERYSLQRGGNVCGNQPKRQERRKIENKMD
jgi:hypothetical protein